MTERERWEIEVIEKSDETLTSIRGIADRLPEIGQSFVLHKAGGSFYTTKVIAVREDEFDTQRSTYKYNIISSGKH